MDQKAFNKLMCELAYQLQENSPDVECTHEQFIMALKVSCQFQPEDIRLMIKETIDEMNK